MNSIFWFSIGELYHQKQSETYRFFWYLSCKREFFLVSLNCWCYQLLQGIFKTFRGYIVWKMSSEFCIIAVVLFLLQDTMQSILSSVMIEFTRCFFSDVGSGLCYYYSLQAVRPLLCILHMGSLYVVQIVVGVILSDN